MAEPSTSFTISMPDDFHAHLRQGIGLSAWVRGHAGQFGRVLCMPNTLPPVSSVERLLAYREEVTRAIDALPENERFEPLFSFKILPGMRANEVEAMARTGAIAGKYYPSGATTNAADGPRSFEEIEDTLCAMEKLGIVLCIHGEDPQKPVLERERAFLPQVSRLIERHPTLRIVLEHLSDAESVRFVEAGPENLAATITAHHLLYTLDDMVGESMNPHLYCKPVLKFERDREALRSAVMSGSKKFFFGSDSAPHPRAKKENGSAAPGVFSSLSALPALVALFDGLWGTTGREKLVSSMSEHGADFYALPRQTRTITIDRSSWRVPEELGGAVPMCAGQTLAWKVE
jgi:dihydroorotase